MKKLVSKANKMAYMTGWNIAGYEYASIFEKTGLEKMANLLDVLMQKTIENKHTEKFTLLDPVELVF